MRIIGIIGNGHSWSGVQVSYEDTTGQFYFNGQPVANEVVQQLRPYIVANPSPTMLPPVPPYVPLQPGLPVDQSYYPPLEPQPQKSRGLLFGIIAAVLAVLLLCTGTGMFYFISNIDFSASGNGSRTSSTVSFDKPIKNSVVSAKNRYTKAEAYKIGTGGNFSWIEPTEIAYTNTPPDLKVAGGMQGTVLAQYLPESNSIEVYNTIAADQQYTLRHEYGHALFFQFVLYTQYIGPAVEPGSDLERTQMNKAITFFNALFDMPPMKSSGIYNKDNYGVISAWEKENGTTHPYIAISTMAGMSGPYEDYAQNSDLFGAYGATNFFEWFAEAYAAYLNGDKVPDTTKLFFDTLKTQTKMEDGVRLINWRELGM